MKTERENGGGKQAGLNEDVIRRMCRGDRKAANEIVKYYEKYAKKCIWVIAIGYLGLKPDQIPMDDILQRVWMKFIQVIPQKFTKLD